MPEDASGQDALYAHLTAILDEKIASLPTDNDYASVLEAYADAIIEGLNIKVTYEDSRTVLINGAFSRVTQ